MQAIIGILLAFGAGIFGWTKWVAIGCGLLFMWGGYDHARHDTSRMGLVAMAIIGTFFALLLILLGQWTARFFI